jgi:hypothetical protein
MITSQSIYRLRQGLLSIVSGSRSSLSDEEVNLLEDCIAFLDTLENVEGLKKSEAVTIVARVIEILLRVLLSTDFDKLKHLFF